MGMAREVERFVRGLGKTTHTARACTHAEKKEALGHNQQKTKLQDCMKPSRLF